MDEQPMELKLEPRPGPQDPLPVNSDVLIWARERCGLSVEEAATNLKVRTDSVIAWEEGKSTPTPAQVRRLAKAYSL